MRDWTYFIQAENGGPIKIGYTSKDNPEDRLRDLQTGNPNQLRLVAAIPSNIERDLHRKFSHIRIKGEWFESTDELLSFIDSLQQKSASDPESVSFSQTFEDSGLSWDILGYGLGCLSALFLLWTLWILLKFTWDNLSL